GDGDLEPPLETAGGGQGNLHVLRSSTTRMLVRKERLELSRVTPPAPKADASTSSATFARVKGAAIIAAAQTKKRGHPAGCPRFEVGRGLLVVEGIAEGDVPGGQVVIQLDAGTEREGVREVVTAVHDQRGAVPHVVQVDVVHEAFGLEALRQPSAHACLEGV